MSEKARDGRQRRASEGKGAKPVGRVGARAHSKPAGQKKRDVAVACAYRLGSASFRCVAPPNRASQTRQPGSIPENTRKCSSSSPLERERESEDQLESERGQVVPSEESREREGGSTGRVVSVQVGPSREGRGFGG